MRFIFLFLFLLAMCSCGADQPLEQQSAGTIDTSLRIPFVQAGTAVDTNLSSLRIYRVHSGAGDTLHLQALHVEIDTTAYSTAVNVYADSAIAATQIDSIVSIYCAGKDLRLIGANNGQQLAIPFHGLHRFKPHTDSMGWARHQCHLVFAEKNGITVNEWTTLYAHAGDYFKAFYGDAFRPLDSSYRFPQRKPYRETLQTLMLEGQAWDETDMKHAQDTAVMLAAYNEFVNKLEIYDKVGAFCALHMAMMDVDAGTVSWGRLMEIFAEHYATVQLLRSSAKTYLADRIANNGGNPDKQFTEEDLRVLYPDRLRWSGWISGAYEHHHDPAMLAPWYWGKEIEVMKEAPPEKVPHDRN